MPTMELNKGDAEDSDYEEECNVTLKKIETVVHMRKLVDVHGDKIPLTISLLGYDNSSYLGIKVVAYDPRLIKEVGFFFTVNQDYWVLTDEQKLNFPKKKAMKAEAVSHYKHNRYQELNDHYHLPEVLRK